VANFAERDWGIPVSVINSQHAMDSARHDRRIRPARRSWRHPARTDRSVFSSTTEPVNIGAIKAQEAAKLQAVGEVMVELFGLLAAGALCPRQPTTYELADGPKALAGL